MANRYELNYDWSKLGPTEWTDFSVVTLQVDLRSLLRGAAVRAAGGGGGGAMRVGAESEMFPVGEEVAYDGGCRFPDPVRVNDRHVTAWIVSQGQDAFDSIAQYAEELRGIAEKADPDVIITWTELPHR